MRRLLPDKKMDTTSAPSAADDHRKEDAAKEASSRHKKKKTADRFLSIQWEFAALFFALMAGAIALILLVNSAFLEKYYRQAKQETLKETYARLEEAAASNSIASIAFGQELTQIANKDSISILVMDEESKTVRSVCQDQDVMMMRMWDNILENTDEIPDDFDKSQVQSWQADRHAPDHYIVQTIVEEENTKVQVILDKSSGTEFMERWGMLSNGSYYLLRTAMDSLRANAVIANRFILLAGGSVVVLGFIVALLLSGRITRPILQMTELSQKMKQLDFSAKYHGKAHNEIQILGKNMNEMSETLERTISELKNVNVQLLQDIERRDQTEQLQREFISNVTHELKTPIALIQGYAEGLQDGLAEEKEDRDYYCSVIVDEAKKMNGMVQKFLALTHLEFGQNNELNYENFDVLELIRGYLRTSELLVRGRGIQVHVERDAPLYVWGDPFYAEEVFQNYFTNAVNHCDKEKVIDIHFEQKENKVRICVFNTGAPIPEESLPRIWDKFYKVDKARTRKYGGSGVGLSIVKAIMELMHEDYGVCNKENGVEFWYEFSTK